MTGSSFLSNFYFTQFELGQSEKQEQDYVTAEIRVCVCVCVLGYWNHFYRVVTTL